MVRIRQKTVYRYGQWRNTSIYGSSQGTRSVAFTEYSEDEVHKWPFVAAGPLKLRSVEGSPMRVDYYRQFPFTNKAKSWGYHIPLNWCGGQYLSPEYWSLPTEEWKTMALSSIQESSPIVDVPLNILELKDLPRTLRSLRKSMVTGPGNRPVETIADLHLSTQFGVIPLLGLLEDMLNLQRSIANRARSLRKKAQRKRAAGTLPGDMATWTGTWPSTVATSSLPGMDSIVYHDEEAEPEAEAWYTARIEPRFSIPEILERGLADPLGLKSMRFETAWNIIPWSFLVDYFANVSDYIRARENQLLFDVTQLCLMATVKLKITASNPRHSSLYVQKWVPKGGKYTIVHKHRWVYNNPTPSLAVSPFITGGQAANILALIASGNSIRR